VTFLELEENVRNLKGSYLDCNLFCRNLDAPEKFPHGGLYVLKKICGKCMTLVSVAVLP